MNKYYCFFFCFNILVKAQSRLRMSDLANKFIEQQTTEVAELIYCRYSFYRTGVHY